MCFDDLSNSCPVRTHAENSRTSQLFSSRLWTMMTDLLLPKHFLVRREHCLCLLSTGLDTRYPIFSRSLSTLDGFTVGVQYLSPLVRGRPLKKSQLCPESEFHPRTVFSSCHPQHPVSPKVSTPTPAHPRAFGVAFSSPADRT